MSEKHTFREKLPDNIEELKDLIDVQRAELIRLRKSLKWWELNKTLSNSTSLISVDMKEI